MKLSRVERLILINQLKIRSQLEKSGDHATFIEALERGYASTYHEFISNLVAEEVSDTLTTEVECILGMFSALLRFLEDHPEDTEVSTSDEVRFRGFDGNNESTHLHYAEFLMSRRRYFTDLKRDDLNSHMPKLPIYRRMLLIWEELGKPAALSAVQVRSILDAGSALKH